MNSSMVHEGHSRKKQNKTFACPTVDQGSGK